MTFYNAGLDACGWVDKDSDHIVAISKKLWDMFGTESNGNPVCGRKIQIHKNGKTVQARITDQCPGCDKLGWIDMSPSLFALLESPDVGKCSVEWEFI